MQKIIPPINPNTPGSLVSNLQFALLFLLGKKKFKAFQPPDNPTEEELNQWAKMVNEEKDSSSYGEGTTKLVQTFQIQQGLGDNLRGMVEEKTAAILNELLISLGAFNETENVSVIKGIVTRANGTPVAGVFVQAFDKDMRSEELLGETSTGRDGKYEIAWRQSQLTGSDKNEADILMKVFSQQNKTLLFSADFDDIRFNAAPLEVINIVIQNAVEPETIEFDHLLMEVSFHAREIAIADLQENKENLDISFLSLETSLNFEKIEYLVVAHRLEQLSKIDADFFYALLRKDTLLKNDFGQVFNSRLSIGIHTNVQALLFDAALADPEIVLADVAAAAKEMIVSLKVVKESKRNIELLQQYRGKAEEYYKNEHPKKIIEAVTNLVSGNKIEKAVSLFEQNKNDLPVFLDKILDSSFFNSENKAGDPKINSALGELLGFSNEIIFDIIKSKIITKPEDIRKLAKLNKKDWVAELNNAKTTSATMVGDNKTMDLYASAIVRKMEKAYPTTAFMAQLEREKKTVFQNQKNILSFLSKHEDFDLAKDNIDLFLKDKKVEKKLSETISNELKSVQRIFKLVPRYIQTTALLNEKIHSSQSIVALGESRFVKEIAPRAGIEKTEAKEIFKKAAYNNTAAMLIAGELLDTARAMDVASLETSSLALKLETVSKDFPNLKSLFKLTDNCACEHCRSVYSPAAYLVEILQFLDKRRVTDLTITPHITSNIAKEVLFERRPDLGEIDLGCENANTPVKYIDLVCELLEEAIAPDAGIDYTGDLSDGINKFQGIISAGLLSALQTLDLPVTPKAQVFETEVSSGSADTLPHYLRDKKLVCKIINTGGNNYKVFRLRQTLSTAEELAAAPEYVNSAAYDELRNNSFAFKLPFDLNHVEAKAYFNRFDISRAELMQDFQVAANPPYEAIAAEKLGLTDAERNIIVIPKTTMADQQIIWNAPAQWDTPPIAGSVLDYMKRADHFLDKTGLTFNELDLLLVLKFIDKDGNLFIKHLDLSCDTAKKEIANLSETSLDRIHRFLRLQKKTGWKPEIMDAIITQSKLGNNLLDDACLINAATLLKIAENTGIKIEELTGFYGEIPNEILNDDAPYPLYQQVFLNKAKNGFVDERLLPDKVDGSQLLTSFINSIAVAIQLKQKDLEEKLLPILPDNKLNFPNLSYLYASSRLIKKLKLKTDDFVALTQLSAINISQSPQKTMDFIDAVEDFKKSPLKAVDVKFILRHDALNIAEREMQEENIKLILEKLQKGYQTNFTLNKSRFDDNLSAHEQKESLKNELAKLSLLIEDDTKSLGEEDIRTFINFIDKDWALVADAKTFVDDKLSDFFDTTAIKLSIDELESVAATKDQDILDYEAALLNLKNAEIAKTNAKTPAEIAAADAALALANAQLLITLSKYNIASGKNLINSFFKSIASFQLLLGKQAILDLNISLGFKADLEFVKVVLKYAQIKQPALGLISTILLSDSLIDTDVNHSVPVLPAITDIAFGNQYAALKLLHKLLPLINAFKLSNQEVEWYLQNNQTLGWFECDSIPYTVGQTNIDYDKYIAFAGIVDLAKQLSPVPNPADAEHPISFLSVASMLLPINVSTREQFIRAFSLLTGYEKVDVDAIDAHLFLVFDLNNYTDLKNWRRVMDCAESLRKLGADILQITQYIKPVLQAGDVNFLRASLKARYDEDTWLETLKEIMDAIRPQKRNALVAWLLASNPDMKDENDLFDYFLVDVEMESCMPSSRIVQAHGTIQLFVQRCLMGLEPKAAADLNNDKSWEQWKWMKNYRVWEANRKVFLYPENWIEADLRDEKSFLFTEFENELQQNELTEFTAEDAFIKYLEKLDNIAFLEVMATWYQTDIKTMHVFARTKGGDPALYYYRRFEQERYWTPWEKVELDITGDHLLAFVRNNRLCQAWPVFIEEPDPNPKSKIPSATPTPPGGEGIDLDKPKRKLKIQLAISEFANKKWQPKKVSKDGILTPSTFSNSDIDFKKDIYHFTYFPIPNLMDVVCVFSQVNNKEENPQKLNGVFSIAGCKGYPELLFKGDKDIWMPDFLPDFNDTALLFHRYAEQNQITGDDLSVRNGISKIYTSNFIELLNKTPGNFRISFPHQFTIIDALSLIFQLIFQILNNNQDSNYSYKSSRTQRSPFKIPMGSLLPYFKEDSKHAYVIIPGFYKRERVEGDGRESFILTDVEKRTASDVLKLLDVIANLFNKYKAKYKENPPADINIFIQELIADNDFQEILKELSFYEGFDVFYNFLIGKTGNSDIDKILKELKEKEGLVYGEQFKNMYHPLICALRIALYKYGIPELMKRETQLSKTSFNFKDHYSPNALVVPQSLITNEDGTKTLSYPVEDVDFNSDGSYSVYNWELFFHVPLLIATRLTKNQRFEEALTWFHYMFNPTGALSGSTPQKYWVTKPFYLNQDPDYINQRIDTLLYKIADPTTPERKELEFAIEQWRNKPFKPHAVARFRPVAYQKALLMKYIDNLTEWGDNLFRQDTMESIAQATQMYILADKILGPKPRIIPPVVKAPYESYNQIENKLDAFGNALIGLENILPDPTVLPEGGEELPTPPPAFTLSMLYFCIPHNEKMMEYWDRIADRLFKIRHCQNIEGIERSLALFAPPIDPGMLVRAAASGLDISSVLAGMNAPTPYYRFNVIAQKATELAQEIRGLGNALLQTLEKKDAEAMYLLRSEMEIKVLNAVKDMKLLQIKEAKEQIEILKTSIKVTEERHKYYSTIQKIISKEQLNLDKLEQAVGWQTAANIVTTLGSGLALIPDFALGVSGFGGSPHGAAKFGGSLLARSTDAIAKGLGIFSTIATFEANRASILGGYDRRFDDWKLQERLAKKELASIEKQIVAAEIRKEISETDLKNHELQIENAKKTDEFMRSKFTNKELYDWMIGQISSVYFKSYQLAHDFAKKAERCYRFELGNDDTFISYGYWDSMKKGLQSADHLIYDIKRMESSYLDKNKREYELTKHISIAMLDPLALVMLRATGVCNFDIPEVLFDLDHPGHYFRRIKSVSISLPCIAGPYTSVSAKFSQVNNRYRKNTNPDNAANTGYTEDPGNDERFIYNVGSIQSIAASNAQNDSGVFELNFRDERYLPFEGTGAISSWRLELPSEIRQFDYNTIPDVIIHMKYTASEGGSGLKNLANTFLKDNLSVITQQLNQEGLHVTLNMKHDLSNEWNLLKNSGAVDLKIDKSRLPFIAQTLETTEIESIMLVAKIKDNPAAFTINVDGVATNLARADELNLCKGINSDIDLNTLFTLSVSIADKLKLEELILIVKYSF